jgi:hypothetical protein
MLDLRLPVGVFFTLIGAILLIDGLVHPALVLGIPVTRDWGACLLVFGLLMGVFGWRAQKKADGGNDPS